MSKKQKQKRIIAVATIVAIVVMAIVGGFFARRAFAELASIWTKTFKELPLVDNPALCPSDMVWVSAGKFCIDKYEASNGGGSYYVDMNGDGDVSDTAVDVYGDGTLFNETTPTAKAVSVSGANPWVSINQVNAKAACRAAGKRLATNYELLLAAKGTPDPDSSAPTPGTEECNIWTNSKPSARTWVTENQAVKTMENALCVSDYGAYDLIGNVWEWTDNVINGGLHPATGVALSATGDITGLDIYGIPSSVGTATPDYNYDHFWINAGDYRGFLRGGTWSTGADAGLFALNSRTAPSNTGSYLGFRCAR